MKVVRADEVARDPVAGPLFPVGSVTRQSVISSSDSRQLGFTLLSFGPGARNALHRHSHDQVLLVTAGTGIAGTPHKERVIAPGDVVLFPAGELHWHAGHGDLPVAFLSVTPQGTTTTVPEL